MGNGTGGDLVENVETKSLGKQVLRALKEKDLSGLAQQIAYNILFSLAPLLIFITAAAGAVTQAVNSDMQNPAEPVLKWMEDNLPADAAEFLQEPMASALQTDAGFLMSFGAIFALWGAKNAMSAIIKGLNIAYDVEEDSRGFVKQNLVAIGLTIGLGLLVGLGGAIFVLGTGLGDDIANGIGLGGVWTSVSEWLRWPLIVLVLILGVALIHSFGPNIDADLKWFLPGAAFTVVGIGIATVLIGVYFAFSGGYSEAYGAFGSVLAFIFWLYIVGLIILLGGVINMAVQKEVPPARRNVEEENAPKNDNEDLLATEGTRE
jgi:membrane protein